jgi:hypothetical protein
MSRRLSLVIPAALAAALVLAGSVASPAAAKGVRLRYGLKPSSAYDQQGSIALDLRIDPSTLPEAMAAIARSTLGDVRQEIRIKGRLEVQPRAADGSIPFTFKVVDAMGALVRSGETKPLTGIAAMVGRPAVEARFSADGRRVEFAPAPETPQGRHDRGRDQLAQSLPELPEGELRVGQSFEARVPVVLPGAGGRGEDRVEARWIYTLKAIELGRARFDVRQVLPNATATATQGRSYTMAGGAVGTATFDLGEGLFTDISLDADMSMTVNMPMPPGLAGPGAAPGAAPGPDGAASGALSAGMLTLGSKVTGPIAVTMSRAATPGAD